MARRINHQARNQNDGSRVRRLRAFGDTAARDAAGRGPRAQGRIPTGAQTTDDAERRIADNRAAARARRFKIARRELIAAAARRR